MLLEMFLMLHQKISGKDKKMCRAAAPFQSALLVAGFALLATPTPTLAQRGGGGGGNIGAPGPGAAGGRNVMPIICVHDCPALRDGLSADDSLKDFHRAMAVQATDEQRAAFTTIAHHIQDASERLQAFRESLRKTPAGSPPTEEKSTEGKLPDGKLPESAISVIQAIAKARAANQNFLTSFSAAQESGLKDATRKLASADSDLDKQSRTFDQLVHSPKPESEQLANSAANLDKTLASFQSEHLALGKEMSILFSSDGQELTFNLPPVTKTIDVAGQTLSILTSGTVSRLPSAASTGAASAVAVESGRNLFNLKLTADLSDLQQNITAILRAQLTRSPRCGERIEIQQATLIPLAPSSLVVANVHYERWVCPSRESPMEVTSGEGEIEVKLSAAVDPKTGLILLPEISRVTAAGSLRDLLRSGDLGETLRDQIAASLFATLQKTADLNTDLPPAIRESATLQKAQFQQAGVEQLNLVLEGQFPLSDVQTGQLNAQLQQRQSAQGTPAPK
jgi:hypothetical protein